MPYIPFTDEQKQRTNSVDLVEFLRRRGERLLPSGRDKRLDSDHSVTIRGCEWFDHAVPVGGRAISFVQRQYGLSYQEAVKLLLNGEDGAGYPTANEEENLPPAPFVLPPRNQYMRRLFAYLMERRGIDRSIVLMVRIFRWVTGYFREVNQGIESLLADDEKQIQLSPEMLPFERKLNSVKQTLAERKRETALAEQRKDELVMYLAHDIRTPLTSVIGYLNLLEEDPNMPPEQRAARVHIALEKAYRLETMVHEFFEITKYKSQKITLTKETIDLYYMLVQLSDELSPVLIPRGNTVTLHLDENLTIEADPEKLARVFNNILKNAASYSFPHTEIVISAEKLEHEVIIRFQNSGEDIPNEALVSLFDKFYRVDQSRSSDTGGTGLGLAIAKEIVTLHGGAISASSKNHVVTFTISLPLSN